MLASPSRCVMSMLYTAFLAHRSNCERSTMLLPTN